MRGTDTSRMTSGARNGDDHRQRRQLDRLSEARGACWPARAHPVRALWMLGHRHRPNPWLQGDRLRLSHDGRGGCENGPHRPRGLTPRRVRHHCVHRRPRLSLVEPVMMAAGRGSAMAYGTRTQRPSHTESVGAFAREGGCLIMISAIKHWKKVELAGSPWLG
jgi:hypothetical protein